MTSMIYSDSNRNKLTYWWGFNIGNINFAAFYPKLKKYKQYNHQKKRTMIYKDLRLSNTNPLKTVDVVVCFGRVSSSCITSAKRKGPDYEYDKRNISVVICDTDIPQWLNHGGDRKTVEVMTST